MISGARMSKFLEHFFMSLGFSLNDSRMGTTVRLVSTRAIELIGCIPRVNYMPWQNLIVAGARSLFYGPEHIELRRSSQPGRQITPSLEWPL